MKVNALFLFVTIVIFFTQRPSSLLARTFKTLGGVPIEASFEKLDDSGSQQFVILKMERTGREYRIPLARLSKEDQAFVKGSKANKPSRQSSSTMPSNSLNNLSANSSPPPPQSGKQFAFSSMLSNLVSLQGTTVRKYKAGEKPEYIAFYFAAGWCAPCKRFTPKLAKYYKYNIDFSNPKFEIIFVSRDNSKADMVDYMKESQMPWPAVNYTNPNRTKLIKEYAPSGTPSLVLVDRSGKVISESFVDGNPRGAFAVKQDMAVWFTQGERNATGRSRSSLTKDKRVSD